MTIRPFRFGLVAGSSQLASLVALARRAESLGFHTLLMPDPLDGHDPLAVLASVAAATERLYVGTYVLVDAFRDKRMLCWQASTLHELSGGRFELGLGAGRPQAAEHAHDLGVTFPSATDRVERLAETVEHLKASERRPPLLLAARGAKMRALAARTADIVTMAWQPRTGVEQARSLVDDVRARAGGRLDDLELAANILAVGSAGVPWLEKLAGVSVPELARAGAVTVLPGSAREGADLLRRWRESLGISYYTVNAGFVDSFAAIIEELSGE